MSYSRFLEYLDKDKVKKVDLFENGTIAIVEAVSPELGNRVQRVWVQLPGLSQELLQKFREKNIDFAVHNAQEDSGSLLFNLIGNLAFPLILIGGLFLLSRRSSGGMGGPGGPGFPLAFGQSKAKFQMEPNTGVTFDDVAGVDEAKQDFMEVVEFLKKPERFTAVGARIPKGVLVVGPPGTGKTLLAKAIAGEAGVPFFSISGSEFVEMFVGVGASRVGDLFKKAKENAPCIVFVDEIDAVGRQRGTGIGEGNDEREQTLNQLLTEMDGFEGNTGIIVIAATNRADILGSALLRPGRFDRQVTVDVPDIRGRTEILKVHGSNKKFDADVSLEVIAMRTPGFSGADLANLLNEAAILAGRRGKSAISSKEIDDSIDRIVAGMEGTVMTDGKSKSLVAYHEVGHAICGTLTPGHDPVQKVTLIPRELLVDLVERAAEEVIFGEPDVTTGAAGDLQQITGLAKQMVTTFGMSEIGPWSLMESSAQSADVTMRMMARNSMSEKLAEDIDTAVKRLSDRAYEIALTHIRNNREAIDKIVEILLEKETITGEEFRAILSEFVEIPAENRVIKPSQPKCMGLSKSCVRPLTPTPLRFLSTNTSKTPNEFTNLCSKGRLNEAFESFTSEIWSDPSLFSHLLQRCIHTQSLSLLKHLHSLIITSGSSSEKFVSNHLVNAYAKIGELSTAVTLFDVMPRKNIMSCNILIGGFIQNGDLESARQVFGEMPERNVATWNAMVAGMTQFEFNEEGLSLISQMHGLGFMLDEFTLGSVLRGCAGLKDLNAGMQVHGYVVKSGFEFNLVVGSSLAHMYMKSGSLGEGERVIKAMPIRNVVACNTLIAGRAQKGFSEGALDQYNMMKMAGFRPDKIMFVSVISSCSELATLGQGQQIHAEAIKTGASTVVGVISSLISMYSRCGCLDESVKAFLEREEADVVLWSSMIAAYGFHGKGEEAIELFNWMDQVGLDANDITFLSLLYACSHCGLKDKGLQFFNLMIEKYGLEPRLEHYTCVVDLLGRSGCLEEAEGFIRTMPVKKDAIIWM
ncbi:hypothetical protein HYC85_015137 [Camellia sinensis]|uniref:ATP-dependent zinc metalloprotease FTSH, chloroplastic n=1 Tax=Camellia sinensis TaxID=4442 RepID=A0A7J7H8C8_CAMSI|nr:hypothetical protein HYC85_015137 [Camellia sinensis]